jgi:sec-independent protein translocase protein TatC
MATALRRPIGHEDRLSLVEHLDELRSRLITCLVALLFCFAFTYWQNDNLLDLINKPLESTQNLNGEEGSDDPLEQSATAALRNGQAFDRLAPALTSINATLSALAREEGISASTRALIDRQARELVAASRAATAAAEATPKNRERQPVTLGVTEPFITTFSVAMYAALLLAMPFLLFQAYAFVLPAFSPGERRLAIPFMVMVPVLFVAGVVFGYYLALPRAIDFLQNFNDDSFDILIGARDYYRFSIVLLAVIGLLFQIPVGVLAVTRLGIVSARTLQKNRGYVLLGIAVLAAVATPTPDPVTMLISMAPLVVLFELSTLLARVFEPKGPSRWSWDDEDENDPDAVASEDDDPLWDDDDDPRDGDEDPRDDPRDGAPRGSL